MLLGMAEKEEEQMRSKRGSPETQYLNARK
jgi:hypothetical protein